MNTIKEGYIAVCKQDGQVAYIDYDDMAADCPYFTNHFFYDFIALCFICTGNANQIQMIGAVNSVCMMNQMLQSTNRTRNYSSG